MNVSLPAGAAAATSITRNEGEMTNKGFEFAINSHNLTGEYFLGYRLQHFFQQEQADQAVIAENLYMQQAVPRW